MKTQDLINVDGCYLCLTQEERAAEFDRQCQIEFDYMVRARAAAAEKIWEWRATAKKVFAGAATPLSTKLRIMLMHNLVKGYHAPIKPERRRLLRAAADKLSYSRTPWCNPHDSEYYSA